MTLVEICILLGIFFISYVGLLRRIYNYNYDMMMYKEKKKINAMCKEALERKYIYCLECQRNNKAYLNVEGTEFVCDVCGHRMVVDGSN